mmetsp:Transcript_19193/g.27666  ORF Transcript_19193/g.27666 Transcript_19193/m.27666 type:complete len:101 (-) Transcript_19193:1708-2010(-)
MRISAGGGGRGGVASLFLISSGVAFLLQLLLIINHINVQAFSPTSSFIGRQCAGAGAGPQLSSPQSRSNTASGSSKMNMMFDQLSNAIGEVTKNMGPKKR